MDARLPPKNDFWQQSHHRREPCAHPIIPSTATRSIASPPSTCKPTSSSRTTSARPRPRSSGRCCWPPPPGSPRCPTPASASATPPPTRRPARPCWPPCPTTPTLQRQLNAALAGHLPKALRKHLQRLAIDLTLIPYHGQPFRDLDEIYRGQAKDGTSHFHAYATAYVVRQGQRYTVALTGVTKGEPLKDVVQRLLRQAASVGVRPRLAAAGSRLLQRGGGPLPPGGAAPVPDAGGLPRPLAQAARAAPAAATSSGPGRRAAGPPTP